MADLNLNVGANTSNAQASVGQLATLTEAQMKRIASFVRAASDEQKKFSTSLKDAANSASYKQMAEGAEKVRAGHAGVNRELLVLTHELSQGNFSRFGGSMLVLAEQTNALSFAMTGAGAATLGILGALGGFVAAAVMGEVEASKFAKALQLTGNYAATSAEQIKAMALAQSAQTGQSTGAAQKTLEAAAGSGLFGPQALASVARAMGDYQRLTGASAEDALAKFRSLEDGVAKWAETENKSLHFLSAAEYDRIKALEDAGEKEKAAIQVANDLAQALESRGTPAVKAHATAWEAVKESASAAVEAVKNLFNQTRTPEVAIASIDKQIALMRQANTGNPGAAADTIAALQAERQKYAQEAFRTSERQAQQQSSAAAQAAAIDAKNYIDGVLKGAKALSERTKELDKWKAAVAQRAAAGDPMSAADQKAGVDAINKRFADPAVKTQANEYAGLSASVQAFNDQTDVQVAMQRKLTDAEQFGIRVKEDLAKAGAKLNDQQRTSIRLMADAAASRRAQAEIDAKVHPVNSPESDFRTSELAATGATNEAVRQAQLAEDAIQHAKLAQQEFNSEASNGYTKASVAFIQQANNNAAQAEQIFNDAAHGMATSIEQFAMTGKLSFKGLVDSLIADLIRFQAQKAIAGLVDGGFDWGGGNSPLKLLGSLGSDSSSGLTGTFGSLFSGKFGGGFFAGGIDEVPYNGMPAVLHEGERVMTRIENQRAKSGGDGGDVHIHMGGMSFGAGVDAASVAQAVRTGMAQTKAEIQRSLATGRTAR